MRKTLAFLTLLTCVLLSPANSLAAVAAGGVCVPNSETEQCNTNLYCEPQNSSTGTTYKCVTCPETHPYSEVGSDEKSECYKTCTNKSDFQNGTWAPDKNKVYHDTDCTYTMTSNIKCNNESDQCSGYHRYGTTCVPNKQTCTDGKHSGFQLYYSDSGWSTTCYITECADGYHMDGGTVSLCGENYGNCESNTQPCNSLLTCDGGIISGSATWNGTTYDYTECTCKTAKYMSYGNGTQTCTWTNGAWGNCKTDITSCNAGYWADTTNPNNCTAVGHGYYSANGELTRSACPAGSTTNSTTATAITECTMIGGKTQICDNNKCFTLPVDVSYHN